MGVAAEVGVELPPRRSRLQVHGAGATSVGAAYSSGEIKSATKPPARGRGRRASASGGAPNWRLGSGATSGGSRPKPVQIFAGGQFKPSALATSVRPEPGPSVSFVQKLFVRLRASSVVFIFGQTIGGWAEKTPSGGGAQRAALGGRCQEDPWPKSRPADGKILRRRARPRRRPLVCRPASPIGHSEPTATCLASQVGRKLAESRPRRTFDLNFGAGHWVGNLWAPRPPDKPQTARGMGPPPDWSHTRAALLRPDPTTSGPGVGRVAADGERGGKQIFAKTKSDRAGAGETNHRVWN